MQTELLIILKIINQIILGLISIQITKKKIRYKKIYYSNNKKKFYYTPENSEICYYSPAPCTHLVDENLHYKEINNYILILKNH